MSAGSAMGMDLHVALVHHPVLNRHGETVATAVTNLDLHDLARSGRTFDVVTTWIVTPLEQQRSLVTRILDHWQQGEGQTYNPIRAKAFERVRVAESIDALVDAIVSETGQRPIVVGTGASLPDPGGDTTHADDVVSKVCSFEACRDLLATGGGPMLLLFGTGWGLVGEVLSRCDHLLPGVNATEDRRGYNHLSVRAAVAIILDRLAGDRLNDPP